MGMLVLLRALLIPQIHLAVENLAVPTNNSIRATPPSLYQ